MDRVARLLAGALLLGLLALATWRSGARPGDGSAVGLPNWTFLVASSVWWLALGGLLTRTVRDSTPLAPRLPAALWLGALSGGWAALMTTHEAFAWVAFPLFLLWLMHLPLLVAVPAVLVLTGVVGVVELAQDDGRWGGVLGPALAAAACIVGAWTMTRLRRESEARARLLAELRETREELATAHAQAGALAERHRIARDLHDTVVQSFTSVLLLTRAGGGTHEVLPRIEEVAADGLAESRRVVEALRREPGRTLADALRNAAAGVVEPPTTFSQTGTARELPTATEVGLLRIAQGALGNVTEHAGATRAWVHLTFTDDAVRLEVRDDGEGGATVGAVAPTTGRGTGLAGTRDRAHDLGGRFSLESPAGGGTRLVVEVPA
ncbi:sensor histidine kinase [Kytococcus sedentarius]|uniref:sensor histidine kinase n=1 Tax=Kytococcus sedentarius TaxID=1276 RepID=UPI0035BBA086